MTYQDIWTKNGKIINGTRECNERYEIIKSICDALPSNFSALDIGANMSYFGLRLTNDFKDCSVIGFEYNSFKIRKDHIRKNGNDRIILINHKLKLNDIRIMKKTCKFNLILLLSVLHHLDGSCTEWINELKQMADNIIIEFALDDSKRTKNCKEYKMPNEYKILGHGKSHLDKNINRQIILVKGDSHGL